MEDHDRPVLGQDPGHDLDRGNVREPGHELGAGPPAAGGRPGIAAGEQRELAIDVVQRAFRPVEQHQPRRVEIEHLARQLRPDGPARAGDKDRPAGHERAQARLVHDDRVAPQEVGHLHLADRRGAEPARHELVERGDRSGLESEPGRVRNGAPDHVAGCAGERDQEPVGACDPHDLRQLVDRAEDLDPAQDLVPLGAVVIEHAHHAHAQAVSRRADGPQRGRADVAGAVDEGRDSAWAVAGVAVRAGAPAAPFVRRPDEEPDTAHPGQREHALEDEERARKAAHTGDSPADTERGQDQVEEEDSGDRSDDDDDEDPRQLTDAGIRPRPRIEAASDVDRRPHQQREQRGRKVDQGIIGESQRVKPQDHRADDGQRDDHEVDQEQMTASNAAQPKHRSQSTVVARCGPPLVFPTNIARSRAAPTPSVVGSASQSGDACAGRYASQWTLQGRRTASPARPAGVTARAVSKSMHGLRARPTGRWSSG